MSRVQNTTNPQYIVGVPNTTYQTTSNYTPAVGGTTTTYTQQPAYYQQQVYQQGPVSTGVTYNTANYAVGAIGSGARKAVAEEIPVESRIEYIPFEKKYVEYEQIERVYSVPVEIEVVEYEEVVRNERIPYERTITDYYAVETQVEYIRREIEETIMVEQPVETFIDRVQYIPVETQIVHYPQRDNYVPAKTQMRTEYINGPVPIGGTTTTTTTGNKQIVGGIYQNSEVQGGSRVGGAYVSGGSGVAYQTGYTQIQPTTYTTTQVQPVQYSTQSYQVTNEPTYQASTYQNGYAPGVTYVTGGSGVRGGVQTTGFVTGGSGVRGSNVKQNSYETKVGASYY